jgi:hypothetical protein
LCIGGYEKFFSSRLWSDLRETLLSRVAYGEKKIFFWWGYGTVPLTVPPMGKIFFFAVRPTVGPTVRYFSRYFIRENFFSRYGLR